MDGAGPDLESLLHRLADAPGEFLQIAIGKGSGSDLLAIVCDALRAMSPDQPPELAKNRLAAIVSGSAARQKLVSLVCWLLHHDWFLARPKLTPAIWKLLASDRLTRLAGLAAPESFVNDPDRREELVRICLDALGLRPKGETAAQAADQLTTLDSVERDRVLRLAAVAEKRAREVREAMARAQAQDAASRYGE
jgi:hypothetical protein